MTVEFPARNVSSLEATVPFIPPLPRDSDYPSRQQSKDAYMSFEERNFKSQLIGPKDATDNSRPYILNRIERISEVVVGSIIENPEHTHQGLKTISKDYSSLHADVQQAVQDGSLRLGKYRDMLTPEQIESFISDSVTAQIPQAHEAYAAFSDARVEQALHPHVYTPEVESDPTGLQKKLDSAQMRIINGHHLLVEQGVSLEVIASYDHLTGIETAIEAEKSVEGVNTGKFWQIVGRKGLQMLRIRSPHSSRPLVVRDDVESLV